MIAGQVIHLAGILLHVEEQRLFRVRRRAAGEDEFVGTLADSVEREVGVVVERLVRPLIRRAGEQRREVFAVDDAIAGDGRASGGGEGREQVEAGDQRIAGRPRLTLSGQQTIAGTRVPPSQRPWYLP